MIKTVHLASTNLNSNMGTTKIAARKIAPVPNHNPGGGEFVGGQSSGGNFPVTQHMSSGESFLIFISVNEITQ